MTTAIMRTLPDGRYELHCFKCGMSLIPDLPISVADMIELVNGFDFFHRHADACAWTYDSYYDLYESSCGLSWQTGNDYGPSKNEMHYCPKCGRQLVVAASEEEE